MAYSQGVAAVWSMLGRDLMARAAGLLFVAALMSACGSNDTSPTLIATQSELTTGRVRLLDWENP